MKNDICAKTTKMHGVSVVKQMKVKYHRNDQDFDVYVDTRIVLMDPKEIDIGLLMGFLICISPKIRS